jgi:hypothetical protein
MAGPSKPRQPDSSSSSSSEDYNSSNNESDRERNRTVKNIVQQLARKRPLLDEDEDEDEDDDEKMRIRMRSRLRRSGPVRRQTRTSWLGKTRRRVGRKKTSRRLQCTCPPPLWLAVYGEDWFVGEVGDKEGEPEAEESENYVFTSAL